MRFKWSYNYLILQISLATCVLGSPNVVKMSFSRRMQHASGNDTFNVTLGNYLPVGIYYVNASIGTPKQEVNLQLDTGSSDVWAFGVHSCDTSTSYCLGGACKFTSGPMLITACCHFLVPFLSPGSALTSNFFQIIQTCPARPLSHLKGVLKYLT